MSQAPLPVKQPLSSRCLRMGLSLAAIPLASRLLFYSKATRSASGHDLFLFIHLDKDALVLYHVSHGGYPQIAKHR